MGVLCGPLLPSARNLPFAAGSEINCHAKAFCQYKKCPCDRNIYIAPTVCPFSNEVCESVNPAPNQLLWFSRRPSGLAHQMPSGEESPPTHDPKGCTYVEAHQCPERELARHKTQSGS